MPLIIDTPDLIRADFPDIIQCQVLPYPGWYDILRKMCFHARYCEQYFTGFIENHTCLFPQCESDEIYENHAKNAEYFEAHIRPLAKLSEDTCLVCGAKSRPHGTGEHNQWRYALCAEHGDMYKLFPLGDLLVAYKTDLPVKMVNRARCYKVAQEYYTHRNDVNPWTNGEKDDELNEKFKDILRDKDDEEEPPW